MKKFGTSLARLDWDTKAPEMWQAINNGKGNDEVVQIGSTKDDELKRFYDGNAKSWAKDIHPNGTEPSTWVSVIDYDSSTLELKITFRDGTTCLYKDISPDMAEDFSKADSKGRWVHNNLVVNHHDYTIVAAGARAKDVDLYHRGGLLGKKAAVKSNAVKPIRMKNGSAKVARNDLTNGLEDYLTDFFNTGF